MSEKENTEVKVTNIIRTLQLPLMPLKNAVLFPHMALPLSVGRSTSIAAVEAALGSEDKQIVIVTQKEIAADEPKLGDIYKVGTLAVVRRMARMGNMMEVVVQGSERVHIDAINAYEPYYQATVTTLPEPIDDGTEAEAMYRNVIELAVQIETLSNLQTPVSIQQLVSQLKNPLHQVYLLASLFNLALDKEQKLLEANSRIEALRMMHEWLLHEVEILEVRQSIAQKAQSEMTKDQREYLLRQQLRAIQDELGQKSPEQAEIDVLRNQIEAADLPDYVKKEADRELKRLEKLPSAAPDYQLTRSYLELLAELPWKKITDDNLDLKRAREILDHDHFNLKDVKDRIIEQLAVLKLNPSAKAPILCFVGPPGTGKTSLGESIAKSLGRAFERMSLGGMHDEAELRGHRRTYIGAMPGRILQAIRRSGVKNPLIMLDEIDKLGRDFRGDPAAALMEILDPSQNTAFRDNYLDLPFDLSKVFFITTANTLESIPRPLLDRMEVMRLSGYTDEEKLEIAKRYLVPRQVRETGLKDSDVIFSDEIILKIVRLYTREAGLRELERMIGKVARKVAIRFAEGNTNPVAVVTEDLAEMLGPERFFSEKARTKPQVGVATGLAWTQAGGDVLFIEATILPEGKGLTITGQLGEVMRESAQTAWSYVWSRANQFGLGEDKFAKAGLHIHVPEGATPKDGPSAGVTIAVALASLYSGLPASNDMAMTGEITLSGLVLPVGGIKEKVLAARRAGIKKIILPAENQKDLKEISSEVLESMTFTFVKEVDEALRAAIPQFKIKKA